MCVCMYVSVYLCMYVCMLETAFVDFCTETLRTSSNRCISDPEVFFSGKKVESFSEMQLESFLSGKKTNHYASESIFVCICMHIGEIIMYLVFLKLFENIFELEFFFGTVQNILYIHAYAHYYTSVI